MANYPYNPYNAYKKIVTAKGDWHTAQSLGQDPNQYYQAAIPYYQELYDNGYGALADDLSKSNYTQAKGLLSKYGLKADSDYNRDYDVNQLTGTGSNAPFSTATDEGKLLNFATGYSENGQNLASKAAGIATGEVSTGLSPAVQNLYDSWKSDNNRLNGEIRYDDNGNVVSGLNTEHYNIGRNQLDFINNFDVTQQPYYQGIMDQYRLGGQNAAAGEYASGAATNAGNIDSYAAANANRQQLAFTNAGQQAALAAAQQNAQNWQTLYSQMSADLTNQGTLNTQTLQAAANLYATDAQERMNALDTAGALEQQQMSNAINAYIAKIQDDTQRYGIDAETAMNTENNKAALEQLLASLASQERMNTENNATQRYGYDTTAATARYQTDADVAMNAANNATQRYGYDTSAATARYQTDAQQAMNSANNAAALDQILAQITGQKELAGINNAAALEQQRAATDNAIRQQEATYQLAQQYGVTLDNKGDVVSSSVDSGLADIYSTASKMWNMYKMHSNAELQTPADVLAAMTEYDNDHYGGTHTKEIQTYVKNLNSLQGNNNDLSALLTGIIGSSD